MPIPNLQLAMKQCLITLLIVFTGLTLFGQANKKIYSSDIRNFWIAFDSIKNTGDTLKQHHLIQELYIDKGTKGLKDFIELRHFTAAEWLRSFGIYPKFWASIRPKTLWINNNEQLIANIYQKFRALYPAFHQPDTYFTIGCFRGGGTAINGNLIIGSELASSDASVDASELSQANQDRMKVNTGVVFLTIHESVHTQQKVIDDKKTSLLGKCLQEGSADFIATLLTKKEVEAPYLKYGLQNEKQLWQKFKLEMYSNNTDDWLYNIRFIKDKPADMGYFIGYAICKSYYNKGRNKTLALKEIIELDYSDKKQCAQFLKKANYHPNRIH